MSENHIIFDNVLICINHSSHDTKYMQHFKNSVLFVNNYFYEFSGYNDHYDYILLNTSLYNYKDTVLSNAILENSKAPIHNLKSGGSFSYNL